MGGIIFLIILIAVVGLFLRIQGWRRFLAPENNEETISKFYKQMQADAGNGFTELIYYFFNTGIGYNPREGLLYLQGMPNSDKNAIQIRGVYHPDEIRSVRIHTASESYVTEVEVGSGLNSRVIRNSMLTNFENKCQAEYNSMMKSGLFIRTTDGRNYQIIFDEGAPLEDVADLVDLFKHGNLTNDDLQKYFQSHTNYKALYKLH